MVVISAIVVFLSIGLCLSPLISEEIVQADSPPTITTFAGFNKPFGICFDGANIWVANYGSNNVTKLRASDGTILGTYNVGTQPLGICFDGANIWVTNSGSNSVTKLSASDGTVLGTYKRDIHKVNTPWGICFDGGNIWLTNRYSNTVSKLRVSDGAELGTYNVGSQPCGICSDGSNIWVANWGSKNVTKLSASDGTMLGTYNVGTQPLGICFDGSSVWVANWGSNNITKLKASDGSTIGTYSVGSFSHFICFDGANIWVTNSGSNNVMKLRASDGRVIDIYGTSTPLGICFDGANIWVTNYDGTTVTRLPAIPASESSPKVSESPQKIDQILAPQIPPNILPIIIISCVIVLLVLLLIFSLIGSEARKGFIRFILVLAVVSFLGYLFWTYGIPAITNWFGKNLSTIIGVLLALVALAAIGGVVWQRIKEKRPKNFSYIYVMRNPTHKKDWYKIGHSIDPGTRAEDLSRPTGVLGKYNVTFKLQVGVADAVLIESRVHEKLKKYRVRDDREIFAVKEDVIKDTIKKIASEMGY